MPVRVMERTSCFSQKMKMMSTRVENQDWIQPVFERFIRTYVEYKPREAELYRMIDLTYEEDVF